MKATEEESGQIKKWQEKVRQRDARIKKLLKEIEELRARRFDLCAIEVNCNKFENK